MSEFDLVPRLWLSLGSNQDRNYSIRGAVTALQKHYGSLLVSTVYESNSLGFVGDRFYNLIVGIETKDSPQMVIAALRAIENALGRVRGQNKFASRTIDIDLLTWGELVLHQDGFILPREEILTYAFVLCPLAGITGQNNIQY